MADVDPAAGWPFIVVRYSVNSALPEQRERFPELEMAINWAHKLAAVPDVRSAQVLDDKSMKYAEFNMLWSVPEELR